MTWWRGGERFLVQISINLCGLAFADAAERQSPCVRFRPLLRSSHEEQIGLVAKAPRSLPKLMAVTDDDEEDLWAGLEDNDSKISVSSNLLEVRRARRSHLPLHPPPQCLAPIN